MTRERPWPATAGRMTTLILAEECVVLAGEGESVKLFLPRAVAEAYTLRIGILAENTGSDGV